MAVNSKGTAFRAIQLENPAATVNASQAAIDAGDLEGMVGLYEPEALFIGVPGQVAAGSEAIRKTLVGLLAQKRKFELKAGSLHRIGDVALESYEWKREGSDPDDNPIGLRGTSSAIIHRRADGRWLYVIDNPFLCE